MSRADLQGRANRLRSRRVPFVLATVVRAERPTSAKAGDCALVLPDGTIEGFVGGSCAESTVRLQGLRLLQTGESTLLRITPTEPADAGPADAGRVDAGRVDAGRVDAGLADAGRADRSGRPDRSELAERRTEGLVTVGNPCLSGGTLEIFLEAMIPPTLVHVYGEAPVARAVAAIGRAAGYDVRAVADPAAPIPPDTDAVVVASHGRDEERLLAAALASGVRYVALVASRRRGAAVLAGLPEAQRSRVHTPAGLDIGARSASEVALSILAELVATRPPRHHPDPSGPHAHPSTQPRTQPPRSQPPRSQPPSAQPPSAQPPGAWASQAPSGERWDAHASRASEASGASEVTGDGEVAEAVDPVCGMGVAAAPASLQLEHAGRTWYFCGRGCQHAFVDDPGRYTG